MPNQFLSTVLLTTDQRFSVLRSDSSRLVQSFAYSAFGFHALDGANLASRFNGQVLERTAQGYLLGNGYRSYSPALQRFTCPDSISPFGEGGLNGYVYCDSDPVNRIDPSGHIPDFAKPFRWLLKRLRPKSTGKVLVTTRDVVEGTASKSVLRQVGGAGKPRVTERNIYRRGGYMTPEEVSSWNNRALPQPRSSIDLVHSRATPSGFELPEGIELTTLTGNLPPGMGFSAKSTPLPFNAQNLPAGVSHQTRMKAVRSPNNPWRKKLKA